MMRLTDRCGALCAAFVLCLSATTLFAAAPRFSSVLPRGVQRGTEVELTLTGTSLQDAEELMLYDAGVEVLSLEQPEKDDQKGRILKAKIRIADNCELGTQRLRVRTRSGITEIQNLYVGALPVVVEVEPNTDFDKPQVISNNVTVQGRVDREDVDFYVVEAKKGERLTAEVFGMRLGFSDGGNSFDPYVAILNEQRFELSASDDTPLVYRDAVASIIVPEDGKYTIQIRDAAYQGDGRAVYLLSIGQYPRPQAVVPAGGKPGEKVSVTLLGDVSGPIVREYTLPTVPSDRFGLEVADEHGVSPSAQPFRVSPLDNFIEQEPNNSREVASAGAAPGAFNGVISEPGDVDYFRFKATKGQVIDVDVFARRLRSPLDAVVNVYRADNGQRLGGNDDSRGPDSYVRVTAPEEAEYVVEISDHLKRGGETFAYRVEVSPVSPGVEAQPVDIARYVQPDFVIPQGSGRGMVVNVQRRDFGGPVAFRCEDLPAGVRIECPEGWRGGGTMPVVFYAADDAPVAGKYCHVVAYAADPSKPELKVEGNLMQKLLMTRGQNNDRVWEEDQNRVAMVVSERLPFKIWIETPKVPVVQGGSMNLIVKCEKQEGWDEEISLLMLQNPAGINASGSVKIAKGATEAAIPINAAGNAAVQESMIAIRGLANVNGSVECCTPFVPLRVEEQYVTLKFAQGAVEQGKEIQYPVEVAHKKGFEGEAEVKLVGLPANATAEPLMMTKETTSLVFTVKAAENTPPGVTKNLFCTASIQEAGETVLHNLGTGVLRVDQPLPPKKDAPAPTPMPQPMPVVKTEAPPKPLSRLEMLRLQQQERDAAEAKK
ncbi:MAG: PPC domain-containing protein [Planctomycetaceae bacterium]